MLYCDVSCYVVLYRALHCVMVMCFTMRVYLAAPPGAIMQVQAQRNRLFELVGLVGRVHLLGRLAELANLANIVNLAKLVESVEVVRLEGLVRLVLLIGLV
jgi:hypothetical protein